MYIFFFQVYKVFVTQLDIFKVIFFFIQLERIESKRFIRALNLDRRGQGKGGTNVSLFDIQRFINHAIARRTGRGYIASRES